MPDWFYRTVAKPTLFALPGNAGRGIALGVIGTLGKSRPGRAIIEFMGHMAPEPELAVTVDGMRLVSPIGLGWRVDPERRATRAFAGFGVGFIELRDGDFPEISRDDPGGLIEGATRPGVISPAQELPCPVLLRSQQSDGTEVLRLPSGKTLPVVAWNTAVSEKLSQGVVLQAGGTGKIPVAMPVGLPDAVRSWRIQNPAGVIVVSGGVAVPEDALALREAGADLILLDAGLVFNGPGLVKRCNEALLIAGSPMGRACSPSAPGWRRRETDVPLHHDIEPARSENTPHHEVTTALPADSLFRTDHFWGVLLGVSFTIGGVATLALAFTRVLLPYDEHYLGTTGAAVRLTQPKLFDFMAHDRATLGGVMCGLGLFFVFLSRDAIRRGVHGSRTAFIVACLIGFSTFFSFFGFGYFDTLHAFVSVLLMQMTIQVMTGRSAPADTTPRFIDTEGAAWRRARWGQLFWVIHAVGLLFAGATILIIGMTSVFVSEDIAYLCVSPERLRALGEKFTAVIAHDRATTGGMLLSSGVAMLLTTLWCHRRGAAWLWNAVLWLGIPSYLGTLGVHFFVGYTDWRHLLPAFAGMALWAGGLWLSRESLSRSGDT